MAFGKFGKYYPGGANYRPETLDLVRELQAAIDWFREKDGRAHSVSFHSDAERFRLHTDALHLKYVIVNLLQNAAKYSPPGTPIDVSLSTRDEQPRFTVRDRGIGVPREELDELFSPFYRASNVADRPGTGMGLPIVKKSARLIGATVSVDSELGEGSAFTIALPGRQGRPPA